MSTDKPSGICTALFRCTKCGKEQYQPPGADVIHPCNPSTRAPMKEIKS